MKVIDRRVKAARSESDALELSLQSAEWLTDADSAAVVLARKYAAEIDTDPESKNGATLRALLNDLKLTPKARDTAARGEPSSGNARSALDELRDRRERRAANMDASASRTDA